MRIVTASMSDGPSPARARATAATAASCTANTSMPSTRSPGIPYPAALLAKSADAVVSVSGVE